MERLDEFDAFCNKLNNERYDGKIVLDLDAFENENELLSWNENEKNYEMIHTLSVQYFDASELSFKMIFGKRRNNIIIDCCSLPALFMLRHSFELMIKALLVKQLGNKAFDHFCNYKHSIYDLAILFNPTKYKDNVEWDYLLEFCKNVDKKDVSGDLFRYPFDNEFLSDYRNKFLDVFSMYQIFDLYYSYLENEYSGNMVLDAKVVEKIKNERNEKNNEYLVEAPHGYGYCMIWEMQDDYPGFKQIEGYETIGRYLNYCYTKGNKNVVFPMLFVYRHLVEISLKDFLFHRNDAFRKEVDKTNSSTNLKRVYYRGHEFAKSIIRDTKSIMTFLSSENNWPITQVDDFISQINILNSLDRYSMKFRFPIYKGGEKLKYERININSFCMLCEQCHAFIEGCSAACEEIEEYINIALSGQAEYEAEYLSEMNDYYNFYYD